MHLLVGVPLQETNQQQACVMRPNMKQSYLPPGIFPIPRRPKVFYCTAWFIMRRLCVYFISLDFFRFQRAWLRRSQDHLMLDLLIWSSLASTTCSPRYRWSSGRGQRSKVSPECGNTADEPSESTKGHNADLSHPVLAFFCGNACEYSINHVAVSM